MPFAWDPEKSDANFQESLILEGPTLEREVTRRHYGERRIIAIGLAAGLELTVCYTDRVDAGDVVDRRIISARRSNRRERKTYREAVKSR